MKLLMVIAQERFRDEEFFEPKQIFEKKNFLITVASQKKGVAVSKLGVKVNVDNSLHDVVVSQYDAVVFVGGRGAHVYFDDPVAHAVANSFVQQKKIVGAICAAPSILANAGLLKGKKATCTPDQKENLKANGAKVLEQDVVVDGKFITADGPKAATKFGETIVKALG